MTVIKKPAFARLFCFYMVQPVTSNSADYLYIREQSQLDDYCQKAAKAQVLALDTEFVRTRTLYSKLGLIQVFYGEQVALIDPLCELDLEPFWQLLTNENLVKVLHSCHEDLEVFKKYANRLPAPLFDTQIAGQFLFHGKVLGFGAMVAQELGIELDKGEARTNWLKRPLTDKQLTYAVNDVKYLLPVYHSLNEKLAEQGLQEYNLAEATFKVEQKRKDKSQEHMFLDFGTAWQLKTRELAILQELAKWRWDLASKKDLALGFVAKDATLVAIAQRRPSELASMQNIPGVNPQEIKRYGKAMLECVARAKQLELEQCPVKVPRVTDYKDYKQAYKALKQSATSVANQYRVPIEMLATKKQLNQWIKWSLKMAYAEKPDFLCSWRKDLLIDVLEQWQTKYSLD